MTGIDVLVPLVNANDDTVEVLRWTVDHGARVTQGESIVDLGTTKAAVSVESPADGFLVHLQEVGAIVPIHGPLARVVATQDDVVVAPAAAEVATARADEAPIRLSRAARALGVDETGAGALGLSGLVTARAVRRRRHGARVEPLDRIKRAEVAALTRSHDVFASSVTIQMPPTVTADGVLPHVVCEAARLLAAYPALNGCFLDDAGGAVGMGAIELRDQVDLGIALDLGRGLRVVTLQHAATLTPDDVADRLRTFTERYLDDTLTPEDVSPATFTITDLSALGAAAMDPLIGEDQAAILAMTGGTVDAGTPLTFTLVFDHRVSNGRTAAMFLSDLRDRVLPRAVRRATGEDRRCDRCGVDVAAYYDAHPRDAFMQMHLRPDGSVGLLCHICTSGVL